MTDLMHPPRTRSPRSTACLAGWSHAPARSSSSSGCRSARAPQRTAWVAEAILALRAIGAMSPMLRRL
eukprot:1016340-Heterocapsa_arctica.AAC.1